MTETGSVHYAVRTECLNTIQVNCVSTGRARAMAQAVSPGLSLRRRRFIRRSVYVRYVVDKVALGQGFLQVFRFFRVSTIPPMLNTHFHLHVA
jgi:ABC-type Fe3+ transport system permease subunit